MSKESRIFLSALGNWIIRDTLGLGGHWPENRAQRGTICIPDTALLEDVGISINGQSHLVSASASVSVSDADILTCVWECRLLISSISRGGVGRGHSAPDLEDGLHGIVPGSLADI